MATDYMRAMLDELMGSGGGNDGDGGEGKILTISWVTWVYPFFSFEQIQRQRCVPFFFIKMLST